MHSQNQIFMAQLEQDLDFFNTPEKKNIEAKNSEEQSKRQLEGSM
ncbi:32800_t:CDS:2 [Gigaspora margarita]|uniref:32800_t:CDS:1 n=1 Tax=Gigaspora margarita TaxID=4874 RepID=A0ABN7UF11_GIGMA|nr:32800_t:CDS:2 [Gigaspora margarita]